jgi:Carboxypeptidase regulatory-like domain
MTLTAAGLTNGGVTAHYKFQYDDSLKTGGLEPDRTNAVIAACEGDFNFMRGSFGNIDLGVNIPISAHIIPPGRDGACADPGGCGSLTSSGNLTVTVSDKELKTADASVIRYVIVAEIVEIFMRAQGLGWFGGPNEGSQGEGLSRFLGAQLLALNGFGDPPERYRDSFKWLATSDRMDFVNKTDPRDADQDPKTGCALLFIYYLFSQFGFGVNEIVAAGASPLSAVHKKLSGDPNDPFPLFKKLVDKIFPDPTAITSGTKDNPFPARPDPTDEGILLQVKGKGPVYVIYGNGRFQLPDDATRSRLFPGADVFPYPDSLIAINIVPDEGTLLREESSNQVWIIRNRRRIRAPANSAGTVHVLWDGALGQIPLPDSVLEGVVTDITNGALLSGATVIITSTNIIPSTGSNTEQLTTDAQGHYSSSSLPAGVYSVEAIQGGFVPKTESVTVLEGVPSTPLDFKLVVTVPFTVEGQVTDGMGAPIVATVRLTENSAIPGIITKQTDASGNYSITLDPGPFNGSYTIDVTAVGFTSYSVTLPTIDNGANIPLNVTLKKQGILTGHIKDQRGPALAGAKVTIGTSETLSDVTGAYSIMVDPGTYPVTASARGFVPVTLSIMIPSGSTVPQDFMLSEAITGSITGTVTDDNGNPFGRGARVAALNQNLTTTDNDGKYTLTNLQPGPTQVEASFGTRYLPDKETVTVISGQTVPQDFVLVLKGTRTPPNKRAKESDLVVV